jgi:hypothetical protein
MELTVGPSEVLNPTETRFQRRFGALDLAHGCLVGYFSQNEMIQGMASDLVPQSKNSLHFSPCQGPLLLPQRRREYPKQLMPFKADQVGTDEEACRDTKRREEFSGTNVALEAIIKADA